MSHFLIRWRFTPASSKALIAKPQERVRTATALVEGFGGKLHSYYFVLGEFDGLGICEFADHVSAAAFSMTAASSGGFAHFETTPLLTSHEAEAAMKKAHDTKTSYQPPNA